MDEDVEYPHGEPPPAAAAGITSEELIARARKERASSADLIAHARRHVSEPPPPIAVPPEFDIEEAGSAEPIDPDLYVVTEPEYVAAGPEPPRTAEPTLAPVPSTSPTPIPEDPDRGQALRRARRIIRFVAAAIVFLIWLILANLGDGF